jgi:hypothetical protein
MNRTKIKVTRWHLTSVVCWLILAMQVATAASTERSFQPSKTNFTNPERGFYSPQTTKRMTELDQLRDRGISLLLVEMDLRAFKERDLTPEKLDELRDAFAAARHAGLKVIFRAAYGYTDRDYRADPKDLQRILGHIAQLGVVLTENADTLFAVQAGFLGPWGEWHDSNWGDPPSLEAQRAVLFALLDAIPAPISIQVRRPMFIRDIFAIEPHGFDLTDAAAFGRSRLSRIGWHDDAFLALPDDMGTYVQPNWNRERELQWCEHQDRYVPFGGETVEPSALTPIEQVVREMELLHLTFLNIAYHPKTLQHWRESQFHGEEAFGYIARRLGYRLVAQKLSYSSKVRAGGRLSFQLTLTNAGFASPLLPRVVSIGLIQSGHIERLALNKVDPRRWGPWSGNIIVRGEMSVPKTFIDNATAELAIQLADPSPRLRNDGRFAIRLANDGMPFLAEEGWNILADDIIIHR